MVERTDRRLAAILAADVAGYTRLMEQDSSGTVAAWQAARADIIDPGIDQFNGRIVKHTGDGFLVEFSTVEDAVNCAVALQTGLISSSLDFRMGVNLGDIIDDGEDIHGEGVNLAARLEALAEPGCICISGEAHTMVRNRVDVNYKDMGEHEVKHISHPVRVFAILIDKDTEVPQAQRPRIRPSPASPLDRLFNGRAAVAVLPFRCLSTAADDVFFADGITEDIVNGLAVWRWFPVIGRYSTNHFRGSDNAVNGVLQETGARYVIDGSIRRSGPSLRVSVELCDAASGEQIWSHRFDGSTDDVFKIQDEISDEVARRIEPEISRAESSRLYRQKPSELSLWEILHKARVTKFQNGHAYGSMEDNVKAMNMYLEALKKDPESSDAASGIATCHWHDAINSWSADPAASGANAMLRAEEAIALDSSNYSALATVSIIQTFGQHDIIAGEVTARRSLDMNPSDLLTRHYLVCSLEFGGKFEEAVEQCKYMMKLDPRAPGLSVLYGDMSTCLLLSGNPVEAVEYSRKSMEADPSYSRGRQRLIASLVAAGELTEAKHEYKTLMAAMPAFNLDYVKRTYPFAQEAHLQAYSKYFAEVGAE